LARRDFEQARRLAEGAVQRWPGALPARVVLSHVLLQEGSAPDVAEKALLAILERDPHNKEAAHNLAVLRARGDSQARDPLLRPRRGGLAESPRGRLKPGT